MLLIDVELRLVALAGRVLFSCLILLNVPLLSLHVYHWAGYLLNILTLFTYIE